MFIPVWLIVVVAALILLAFAAAAEADDRAREAEEALYDAELDSELDE